MLQSVAVTSAAVVFPAGIAKQALGAPSLAPTEVHAPATHLLVLIDKHRWALESWSSVEFEQGPEMDAEMAALEAILAYPIETMTDMRAKASYLLEYDHDQYQADMVETLLASMAGVDPEPRQQIDDPLVDAIDAYRKGLAAFNATPSAIIELDDDAVIARTYGPPMRVLMEWEAPAKTLTGAIAAIHLADEESISFTASLIAENMVKAAIAYFSSQVTRSAAKSGRDTPIQRLYQHWKAVRDESDQCDTDEEAQAKFKLYAALQEQITAMKPICAKDMATQLVVETDFGDSDYREVFFERVAALAEKP